MLAGQKGRSQGSRRVEPPPSCGVVWGWGPVTQPKDAEQPSISRVRETRRLACPAQPNPTDAALELAKASLAVQFRGEERGKKKNPKKRISNQGSSGGYQQPLTTPASESHEAHRGRKSCSNSPGHHPGAINPRQEKNPTHHIGFSGAKAAAGKFPPLVSKGRGAEGLNGSSFISPRVSRVQASGRFRGLQSHRVSPSQRNYPAKSHRQPPAEPGQGFEKETRSC